MQKVPWVRFPGFPHLQPNQSRTKPNLGWSAERPQKVVWSVCLVSPNFDKPSAIELKNCQLLIAPVLLFIEIETRNLTW